MTLDEWRNIVEIKGNLIFVPFDKTLQMRHVTISDITVASDNHSFIGGRGFAVSNSAMGKQAVGVYMSNYNHRIDTMAHVLHYPQKALVSTKLSRYVFSDELPCGINAVVAIMTHTGFNQEDSVMMNQSAIDRGLFTSTYFKSYRDQCSKNHSTGEEEVFTKPIVDTSSRVKPFNYDKLGEDGFVPKNTYITPTDIIIGKQMPFKSQGVSGARDTSMQVKGNDEGNIDGNYTGVNGEGYKFCKVRLRKYRKIVIGDKAACYSRDHDVLTTNGWIGIADLTKDHKVATIVNNALVYQQPTELQVYDYKGKMYSVETDDVNLLVTPNHRMYVSSYGENNYKIQEAKKIYHNFKKYKKNIDIWKPDYTSIDVPMSLIIEDGNVVYYRFPESEESPELLIDINTWISLYGIYLGGTTQLIHKYACEAIDDIEWPLLCGYASLLLAPKKRLDDWVYWLNTQQTRKLITTLCLKGQQIDENTWYYRTRRNDLADDIQRLCLHAEYSCNKQKNDQEDYWLLTIKHANHEPIVQNCVDKWVKFEDKVYCCTVPLGDGVIYVRRNGIPIWSGQSRSAQKGCLGMVYGQHEMPFSKNGITPDIIMNPHAIPSRMTMGQLMECIMGKAACHIGACGDATPFNGCSVEDIADVLAQSGYERYGNEILYDGRTGRQINTEIFIGPTYYQRLKHMVSDKCHSRGSNGPIIMLTRQPAEGRARNGGLRFGEMERDCIIGHGASAFLKERMLDVSDNFRVFICRKCGLIPIANPEKAIYKCNYCKNNADISQVRIPYSMKLLIQELMTMSVAPRIVV